MGFEVTLNAIAQSSELLNSVRDGQLDPQLLCFIDYYYNTRRRLGRRWNEYAEDDVERERFVHSLEAMLADNPGIDSRCCDLDRRFEWLQWTLAAATRNESDKSLAEWAITGESSIVANATSTQGFQIRWCDSGKCQLVAEWLGEIDDKTMRSVCDVSAMRTDDLYKINQVEDDDEVILDVLSDFVSLKAFYTSVAEMGEAIIASRD